MRDKISNTHAGAESSKVHTSKKLKSEADSDSNRGTVIWHTPSPLSTIFIFPLLVWGNYHDVQAWRKINHFLVVTKLTKYHYLFS